MMPGLVRGVLELVIQYAFGSRDRNVSKRIQPHNSNSMKGVTLRLSNAESPQTLDGGNTNHIQWLAFRPARSSARYASLGSGIHVTRPSARV
jgi:hypothetical protein